jgi:hypothetical protein
LELGVVARGAGAQHRQAVAAPQVAHLHAAGGESPGLVRADDCRATQRLDRREPPHDGVAGRHALDAERQRDRHHRGKSLRDRGDRERDPVQEDLEPGHAVQDAEQGNERHDREAEAHQAPADAGELPLQRRLALARARQEVGDAPHLRPHARGHDLGHAAAGRDRRAQEHPVASVSQGRARAGRRRCLLDGRALAGEKRLDGLERVRLTQPAVGGHDVPGLEQQGVARNHLGGGDDGRAAVAQDAGARSAQRP